MAAYHVHTTGDHEVHKTGCEHQPDAENRKSLGDHADCHSAVKKAKEHYSSVDGCYYCCNACHKK